MPDAVTGPPPADPPDLDPFLRDLFDDARRLATYGRYASVFRNDELFQAIAEAELVHTPTVSSPEIVKLQMILNDLGAAIPFETQAALKKGWDPASSYINYPRRTYRIIVLAILLMLSTGSLTITYNRGLALLSELGALAELGYRSRMDTLIWDNSEARAQLARLSDDSNPTELHLARDAQFSSEYEIRTLSERMNSAYAQSVTFERDARFLLPGVRPSWCFGIGVANTVRTYFSLPAIADGDCLWQALSTDPKALLQKPDPDCLDKVVKEEDAGRDVNAEAGSYIVRFTNDMVRTRARLECMGLVNLGPQDLVPPISTLIGLVNDRLSPFALWLLPALYGAMGAMLFHLRMILNPLKPDPPLARLLLRLSLGALAGIVLTWFFVPGSRLNVEVANVGFTLFAFAFLFGFSLDVFFAILDRFVATSVASIQRLGGGTGGASPPG